MTTTDTSSTTTATPWTFADVRGQYQGDGLIAFAKKHGHATGDADAIPLPALLSAGYLRGERDAPWRLWLIADLLATSHRAVLVRWAEEVTARARARVGALSARVEGLVALVQQAAPSGVGGLVMRLLMDLAGAVEIHVKRAGDLRAGLAAYGRFWGLAIRRLVVLLDEATASPAPAA